MKKKSKKYTRRVALFENMSGNIPGGNFLWGIYQMGV